jgi:hypothetical protein
MGTLTLERQDQPDRTPTFGVGGVRLSLTPSLGEDYWLYRVRLTEKQALLGFPKFFTVGIGFAVEEDWNTNLPYTYDAEEIYEHIEHNRGDEAITREHCLEAIRLIQEAAYADHAGADE